jgi:multimeric flavodoxin WrbA/putative sterol carrier protein
MNVLALNSSARTGRESKTELMLNHLAAGMREAGANVEVVELRKKKISYCIGCYTCWTKTPGQCIHRDDMTEELFPKWSKADLVVYATPLYHFTVNANLKTFIERTLPVLEPFLVEDGSRTRHPLRQKFPKAVFLSVAGFPEMSVFEQLSSWVRFIFGRAGILVAEIYRPGAEALTVSAFKEKTGEILQATEQAGREIVTSMGVRPETLAQVTQDITRDRTTTFKIANLMWKTCIQENITPREFVERGLTPRPDSIDTFLLMMPMGFNPDAARDLKAVLQFNFSGQVEGSCYLRIDSGKIDAIEGPAEKPDLAIETPFELWMDIMTGKEDGQKAFMEQRYRANGDFSLLLRMKQLFGR